MCPVSVSLLSINNTFIQVKLGMKGDALLFSLGQESEKDTLLNVGERDPLPRTISTCSTEALPALAFLRWWLGTYVRG